MERNSLIKLAHRYDAYGDFDKADIITARAVRLVKASTAMEAAGELRDLADVVANEVPNNDPRIPHILKDIERLWLLVYKPTTFGDDQPSQNGFNQSSPKEPYAQGMPQMI
jgi:hypothetical protein